MILQGFDYAKIHGLFSFSCFIPSDRIFMVMIGSMLTRMQNDKVFQPIIQSIAIYVMNAFASLKLAAKMFFHYKAMFRYDPPFYNVLSVSIFVYCAFAVFSFYQFQPTCINKLAVMRSTISPSYNFIGAIFGLANLVVPIIPVFYAISSHNNIIRLLKGEIKCVIA